MGFSIQSIIKITGQRKSGEMVPAGPSAAWDSGSILRGQSRAGRVSQMACGSGRAEISAEIC